MVLVSANELTLPVPRNPPPAVVAVLKAIVQPITSAVVPAELPFSMSPAPSPDLLPEIVLFVTEFRRPLTRNPPPLELVALAMFPDNVQLSMVITPAATSMPPPLPMAVLAEMVQRD